MLRRLFKSPLFIVPALIVLASFVVILPGMIAGTPCYEVFVNTPPLPPEIQQNMPLEVFNWQGAYGKPWEWEKPGVHLGDLIPAWWDNGGKYGAKLWVELDKVLVLYTWDKATGGYDLVGMAITIGNPPKQEGFGFDVWHYSLVPDKDGSFTAGTFKWLGAQKAKSVVDMLTAQVAAGSAMSEDAVKQVVAQITT